MSLMGLMGLMALNAAKWRCWAALQRRHVIETEERGMEDYEAEYSAVVST